MPTYESSQPQVEKPDEINELVWEAFRSEVSGFHSTGRPIHEQTRPGTANKKTLVEGNGEAVEIVEVSGDLL